MLFRAVLEMLGGILKQENINLKRFLMGYDLLKIYEINHTKNIKLGLEHLAIIDWFTCFQGTNQMKYKIINNEIWYWCSYEKIIADMPILGITNKQVIARLIKSLVAAEIFDYYFDRKEGSKIYIKLGSQYPNLVSAEKIDTSFDTTTYKHKKVKGLDSKVEPVQLKSQMGFDLKVEGGSTKKSNNRLVINRLVNITTTKHKSAFKLFRLSNIKNPSSSSSCEEIKKIEQFLSEKSLNNKTCKNILEAVKQNSIALKTVKEVFDFAKAKNKGIGYVVESLKYNWYLSTNIATKKSDSLEKENLFIKNRELEKKETLKQTLPDLELTPELEKELREKIIALEGIKPDFLDLLKRKSQKTYINTLKKILTA